MASPSPSDHDSPIGVPAKRKSTHLGNGNNEKKKRSRVSFSCSECHRRKQKCDRQQPCGHCIARKVPELCHAYQPGKAEGDLHARLSRVERIIEIALPQYASGSLSARDSSPGPSDIKPPPSIMTLAPLREHSPESSHEDQLREDELPSAVGTLQDQSGPFFGDEALGSVNAAPILEQFHANAQAPTIDEAAIAADKFLQMIHDYGVSPQKLDELIHALPSKPDADKLIDFFFRAINYTRYPIFEPQFRASYEALMSATHRSHAIDLRFLPLLFIVLATAVRLGPAVLSNDDASRRSNSLRYYWLAQNALLVAAAVGESLELVLARLLISRFLTADRRISESWNTLGTAVRTGLALGLHRDGAKLGLDAFQTEYRRRIWSYLYHADRSHALVLGRPPAVLDEFCDSHPPTNATDAFLMGPHQHIRIPPSLPLKQPTPMTFAILRYSLARIIGKIVRHFQQVRPSHYHDVIALDEELTGFADSLPPHYAPDPDTSLDATHPFIAPHRFLIISEIFFVRISLHRPYMLRKLDSDRFAYSRKACFDSAQKDWEIRQAFKKATHPDVLRCVGGGYREFQSAMISGISLAIDPHGPDAKAMHRILDSFLTDHANLPQIDETTRRELKIIELLKSKSLSVAAGEPLHSPPTSSRRRELHHDRDDDGEGGKGRISALRSVPVPVPRPRADSSASMSAGTPGGGGGIHTGATSAFATPGLLSPGQSSSQQSSPTWPSRAHPSGGPAEPSGGSATLSPVDSSSSAQRMLDNWVNNAQMDSVATGGFPMTLGFDSGGLGYGYMGNYATASGMGMGLGSTAGGAAGTNGWYGGAGDAGGMPSIDGAVANTNGQQHYTPVLQRTESSDLLAAASGTIGPDSSEFSYWDNLIEHIRSNAS